MVIGLYVQLQMNIASFSTITLGSSYRVQ